MEQQQQNFELLLQIKIDAEERQEVPDSMARVDIKFNELSWNSVIKYLSFLELCHLSKVNKTLRRICLERIKEWNKIGFHKVEIVADKNLIQVGDIKIRINDKKNQKELIHKILIALSSHEMFPCRILNIKQKSDYKILKRFDWSRVISYITPAANYLTSATFCKFYCRRADFLGFLKLSSNLTTLLLYKISLDKHIFIEADIFENCPKLEFLTTEFCSEILFETSHSPMITRVIPTSIETSLITYQKSKTKESEFHENWKSIDKILSYCNCFKLNKAYKNYHIDLYFLISQSISVLTLLHFVIHTLCKFFGIPGFPEFAIFHVIFLLFFLSLCLIMSNFVFVTVKLNFIHRKLCKISQKYYQLKPFKRKFLANFPMGFYLIYLLCFAFLGKFLNNFQFAIVLAFYCFVCFGLNWSLLFYWVL